MLGVSRSFVQRLIQRGTEEIPERSAACILSPHLERVRAEVGLCKGNLIRVQEELVADGVEVSYSAVTRFVRKHGIGRPPQLPVGQYDFKPGVESQFDTSPHDVDFRKVMRRCQCASLVLGYSRMLFFQYYPRFTRFESKVFLTEALRFFSGACARCIRDRISAPDCPGQSPVPKAEPGAQDNVRCPGSKTRCPGRSPVPEPQLSTGTALRAGHRRLRQLGTAGFSCWAPPAPQAGHRPFGPGLRWVLIRTRMVRVASWTIPTWWSCMVRGPMLSLIPR